MIEYSHDHENEVVLFAETNFRNQNRRFGIKTDDRRRHFYVLGKTGMGKTTLLENMVISDIMAGHGVGVVDPHGDFAEKIIDFIPSNRVNDVVYFNPADFDYPIGFNVLESVDERHKHLVASGLMGVFKKIWPDVWSARMEHILNNCILALLDNPGSTLLGINRLLTDREYRKRVVSKLSDPVVKSFWTDEYARWEDRFRNEAISPIQNKVGQFLSASVIRNIVAQVKSTINIREVLDTGKILIMNLAKGRIGEDSSRLLGGMLITKLQLAAMERVDMPEADRRDFYLYVDEFQNFATQSFASILSEARKYHLNLIIAHQYIEQLDPEYVRPAVFGNVGTLVTFRVGGQDADFLEGEFTPQLLPEDLVALGKYEVYMKLMINGVASVPFSARTLPPIANRTGNVDKVIKVSRERYAQPRKEIEEKIMRWAGFEVGEPEGAPGSPKPTTVAPPTDTMLDVPRTSNIPPTMSPPASGPGSSAAPRVSGGFATPVAAARPVAPEKFGVGAKRGKVSVVVNCSKCGKETAVGFKPDPSRPFYCDDCFKIVKAEREVQKIGVSAPKPPPGQKPPAAPKVAETPALKPEPIKDDKPSDGLFPW